MKYSCIHYETCARVVRTTVRGCICESFAIKVWNTYICSSSGTGGEISPPPRPLSAYDYYYYYCYFGLARVLRNNISAPYYITFNNNNIVSTAVTRNRSASSPWAAVTNGSRSGCQRAALIGARIANERRTIV